MTDEAVIESGAPSIDVDVPSSEVVVDSEAAEVVAVSESATVEADDANQSVDVDVSGFTSMDYRTLANKPSINEVTLVGDKSLEDIGVGRITNREILDIIGRRG